MFDILNFTLAADLADSGAVNVGYPANRTKGNYDWTDSKHVLIAGGNQYSAPANFSLTFNSSNITVTNKTGRTLAAGTACRLQIERLGFDGFDAPIPASKDRMVRAWLYAVDFGSPAAASSNGVAQSQSVGAGANFTLNGSLVANGVATFDVPRNVVAAWTTASVVTVYGTDEFGNALVEASASGTSLTGKKAFKTVTRVTSSASITGATVGTGAVLGFPAAVQNAGQVLSKPSSSDTITAADNTKATATTGDVRGTYAPNTAPDGSTGYKVVVAFHEPDNKGIAQFAG
jgi:hypothetical protein